MLKMWWRIGTKFRGNVQRNRMAPLATLLARVQGCYLITLLQWLEYSKIWRAHSVSQRKASDRTFQPRVPHLCSWC